MAFINDHKNPFKYRDVFQIKQAYHTAEVGTRLVLLLVDEMGPQVPGKFAFKIGGQFISARIGCK